MSNAEEAFHLFKSYAPRCGRIAGMGTVDRMQVRINNGRTVIEAAAREYLYRWSLTLDVIINRLEAKSRVRGEPVFTAPHTLGM